MLLLFSIHVIQIDVLATALSSFNLMVKTRIIFKSLHKPLPGMLSEASAVVKTRPLDIIHRISYSQYKVLQTTALRPKQSWVCRNS